MLTHYFFAPKSNSKADIGVICIVLSWILIGLFHVLPPPPLPANVSASVFSSARAMQHVQQIARVPHPIGTTENKVVRDYLMAELKRLGFEPQIQTAFGVHQSERNGSAGLVNNILLQVRGRVPGKALLLAAHYDSTHTGPGAADDGASVAAILETLRALKTQPMLLNDLICIFTDGEEAGLLGAEAFVAEHPWAQTIALALNFEYRGNRGPLLMFETSRGNGDLIAGFAKAVANPLGNSLMYEVYKLMPNDTDFTVFKRAGMAGMNFAAIEGHTSYHTQLDTPEQFQIASLQHQGETLLELVRYFGNVPLEHLHTEDRIYFDAPGLGMVHYPGSWVMPLTVLLIPVFGLLVGLGVKSSRLGLVRILLAALVFLIELAVFAGISHWLWRGLQYLHPEYALLLQGDVYNSHWYLLAFILLMTGLFGWMQLGLQKWFHPSELSLGALLCWLIANTAVSIVMPGASFLFFWPLLAMLVCLGIANRFGCKGGLSIGYRVFVLLGAAPGLLIYAPLIKALFIGLTPQLLGVVMVFATLLLGLLIPVFNLLARKALFASLSLAIGLALLVNASFSSAFNAQQPRPDNVFYTFDAQTEQAYWLSTDDTLDVWNKQFFPSASARRQVPEIFGEGPWEFWVASAPIYPLPAPHVDILSDKVNAGIRNLKIRVKSQRHAPKMNVFVEGVSVFDSKVEGRDYSHAIRRKWQLKAYAIPPEGLNIELDVQAGSAFKIRLIDFTYGLPQGAFQARPVGMIMQPFGLSDTLAVVKTTDFK